MGSASAGQRAVSGARKLGERLRKEVGPVARKAGAQIGKALHATAGAAERTTKILAVRTKISARQLRIKGLFLRIGESFYHAQKAGKAPEDNAAALHPLMDQVDKLNQEIESLKLQEKKVRATKL